MPSKNNILISLSESDKTQFGKQDFATQSIPQQVFSSVWALEAEVNNGGFSQYFLNDSCETAVFVAKRSGHDRRSANGGYMQAGHRHFFSSGITADSQGYFDSCCGFFR